MNELKVLEDLGASLDPRTPEPPARLRHRVLTQASSRKSPSLARRRLVVAGGLAVVVTAGTLALQVIPFGAQGPASRASAAQVLEAAAAQARQHPATEPRPDQFVYVESITTSAEMNANVNVNGNLNPDADVKITPKHRQIWMSVNGERDGIVRERPTSGADGGEKSLAIPGCHNGLMTQTKGEVTTRTACEPRPGYLSGLPTSADAMLTHLYKDSGGTKLPRDQQAFNKATALIREAHLSPATLAAVFNALSRIGSVTIVGDVIDEAGRAGVAVSLHEVQGTRTDLIFDRGTFAYLGERTVVLQDQDGLKAGQVLNSTAVLKVAIVDRAG